jgi:hypothetical protein
VAKVKNVTVAADENCEANASIDDGSFDPDGNPVTITQSPAGPYPLGTTNVLLTITDSFGATSQASATVTVEDATALAPANVWIGLKNSDDVGTKFDLLAEVFKNGMLIGSGQLNSVPGGSSGFNNAHLRTIPLNVTSSETFCGGGTLSFRLSVRVAADSGHRNGTARLWFNDAQANSNFGATVKSISNNYFLLDLSMLGTAPGPGPKKTIDVSVNRNVGGNPFKPFGTWSITIP